MNARELVSNTFQSETGLAAEQFILAETGKDNYIHILAIKDNQILSCGEFSDIYTDKKPSKQESILLSAMAKMSANFWKGEREAPPILVGNIKMLDKEFLDLIQTEDK